MDNVSSNEALARFFSGDSHDGVTHEEARQALDALLKESNYASTPDTSRLVAMIVRVTNRDLWHDGVCLEAFTTRSCRYSHDWRDVGGLSVPFVI